MLHVVARINIVIEPHCMYSYRSLITIPTMNDGTLSRVRLLPSPPAEATVIVTVMIKMCSRVPTAHPPPHPCHPLQSCPHSHVLASVSSSAFGAGDLVTKTVPPVKYPGDFLPPALTPKCFRNLPTSRSFVTSRWVKWSCFKTILSCLDAYLKRMASNAVGPWSISRQFWLVYHIILWRMWKVLNE